MGNGTQLEHARIAEACKAIFQEQMPVISAAMGWTENGSIHSGPALTLQQALVDK